MLPVLLLVMLGNSSAQPLAAGLDKFLGCATSESISRYMEKYWNQVTPGNAGKWGSVEFARGSYYWTDLDKIYAYTTKTTRNFAYKHHTLIWGQQQPGWIGSLDSTDQRTAIENWIKAVGERYPLMTFVDVVNEPFHAPPVYKNALGGDGATGWDWVITSFALARQYCPATAKLLLNEYNVLHSNSVTTDYINLVTLLKNRGLIDGIGIQGHYFEFRSHTDATSNIYVYDINTIKANLDRLAALGLPIYISEFDIDEQNDASQLAQYKVYFPIFWRHPAVKGITFWGYIQGDVWTSHPYTYLLLSNGSERPAMQWMKTFILTAAPPLLVSPNTTSGEPRDATLVWRCVKEATSYHVQVSLTSAFTATVADTLAADTLVQVKPLEANRRYFWRVSSVNDKGEGEFSAAVGFMTGGQLTAVIEDRPVPDGWRLMQNYPNPFNPSTTIEFVVATECLVQLRVYDLLGRARATLLDQRLSAGRHVVPFDARELESGTYFYRIRAGNFEQLRRMIVVK